MFVRREVERTVNSHQNNWFMGIGCQLRRAAKIRARSSVLGSRRTKAKNLGSAVQTAVGRDGMIVGRLQCVPNAFSPCDRHSTASK
jgi:predicted transcriptional regulator